MAVNVASKMPAEYLNSGRFRINKPAHFEPTVTVSQGRNTPVSGRRTPRNLKKDDSITGIASNNSPRIAARAYIKQSRACTDSDSQRLTNNQLTASTYNHRPKSGMCVHDYKREPLLHKQLGLSRLGLTQLTRKDRMNNIIRPLSASVIERRRKRKEILRLGKSRHAVKPSQENEQQSEEDMFKLVQFAKEAKQFEEDTAYFRELEKAVAEPKHEEESDTPVFNKRLFASQGTVIMTQEARRLMLNNLKANATGDVLTSMKKSDVHCLRCVTDGLKLIHKGQDYVKDVLSKVVTYEMYEAFESVPKKSWEDALSCYYIVNGAVEVTYDMKARESRNVYQANIIYSHGTGEYVGLVSPEGPSEDLTPPATIYTKELTQFIRVDRTRFHKIMKTAKEVINDRKRTYISSHSFLAKVSPDVREKILHKLTIQEYPANRVLLSQDEMTDYLFILMKGRCQTYREVHIPEAGKDVLFYLTSRDEDDFFGEECLLDESPSYCTVVTATAITSLRLHKSALQMVKKELLSKFIEAERHECLSVEELQNIGYNDSVWNKFKHDQIKYSLREAGKLRYLDKTHCTTVLERPPSDEEQYKENMQRFKMKGSGFEPVRAKSATVARRNFKSSIRPHTAFVKRETGKQAAEINKGNVDRTTENPSDVKQSALMTPEKAQEIEKKIAKPKGNRIPKVVKVFYKALDSKEAMMKLLEDNADIGSHLQHGFTIDELQDKQSFMKTGVMMTMTTTDIVRKAKALADTYADKWKDRTEKEEEQWDTVLHAENKQAKFLISANRMRLRDLKRRLLALQKKREKLGLTKYDPDNETTNVKMSNQSS